MGATNRTFRLVVASLREMREPEGFVIEACARRGSEVQALVHRHRPDAVLLELNTFRKLDGIAVIHRLTQRFPEIATIVLAAAGSPENVVAAFAAGARAYILNTVELEQLGDTIRGAIRAQRSAAARSYTASVR